MATQLPRIIYRIGNPENDNHCFTDNSESAADAIKNGYEVSKYILAAYEQEPVADVVSWSHPNEERKFDVRLRSFDIPPGPLYTHPAPSIPAAVPEVGADDNFYSWFDREWHENYQQNQYTAAAKHMLSIMAESAWKASRRAAMLQATPRSDERLMEMPTDSEMLLEIEGIIARDDWIPVSERRAAMLAAPAVQAEQLSGNTEQVSQPTLPEPITRI